MGATFAGNSPSDSMNFKAQILIFYPTEIKPQTGLPAQQPASTQGNKDGEHLKPSLPGSPCFMLGIKGRRKTTG